MYVRKLDVYLCIVDVIGKLVVVQDDPLTLADKIVLLVIDFKDSLNGDESKPAHESPVQLGVRIIRFVQSVAQKRSDRWEEQRAAKCSGYRNRIRHRR